ncbi:RusA family crossover junction endodeoxyribonuclease [Streptomyces sp. NBC_00197]|uniref:RusA family crossover junction endodeoxyribonuclease n=1 Tax=Streptomyces sp. NBC_00197 TaxID=2975676 RepID=UPI00386E7B87
MKWDFAVPGIPMSTNSKNAARKKDWIERVRRHSLQDLPSDNFPIAHDIAVRVVFFHSGPTNVDVDNILKRVIDGLYPDIILDDGQVQDVLAARRDLITTRPFINPPDAIVPYLIQGDPFIHVTIDAATPQEEMPWIGPRP